MIRKMLWHVLCVIVLLMAVWGVFWFNASSASRKTVTVDDLPDPDYTEDPDGQGNTTVLPEQDKEPIDGSVTDGSENTGDGSLEGSDTPSVDLEKQAYDAFISTLPLLSDASADGYTTPTDVYGKGSKLVYEVKLSEYTDTLLPLETGVDCIVYRYERNSGRFLAEYKRQSLPMIFLYGGLMIENRGGTLAVLSWLGEYAASAGNYYPTYATDAEGRYLFLRDGVYYYFDEESGAFTESSKTDYYGVYADKPFDEQTESRTLFPFCDGESGKWGYRDADGNTVIKAQYYRAYEFSDGIAAVQKNKLDGLLFIDTKGKVVLDTHLKYYKYNGFTAYDWYRAPEILDGQAAGCLRFDHGYMRVTVETFALANSTEVLYTKQALVDADGNKMRLPSDYDLVAYSDGVAVLCKNGKYGYYSHEGRWLTQPIYDGANAFVGGLGTVKDAMGKYHVFDTEGNEVVPGVFDYISSLSAGKMLCYREGQGWLLLSLYQKSETTEEDREDIKEENTVS